MRRVRHVSLPTVTTTLTKGRHRSMAFPRQPGRQDRLRATFRAERQTVFWLDAATGSSGRAFNNFHSGVPPFEIEVLKPPIAKAGARISPRSPPTRQLVEVEVEADPSGSPSLPATPTTTPTDAAAPKPAPTPTPSPMPPEATAPPAPCAAAARDAAARGAAVTANATIAAITSFRVTTYISQKRRAASPSCKPDVGIQPLKTDNTRHVPLTIRRRLTRPGNCSEPIPVTRSPPDLWHRTRRESCCG